MSQVNAVTLENFEALVLHNSRPVLVDFWASWCMPCRMLSPVVDELAGELAGRCDVVKLNVDDCQELAARYGVMSIPTLIVFDKGEAVDKSVGVLPKEDILSMVERHLA